MIKKGVRNSNSKQNLLTSSSSGMGSSARWTTAIIVGVIIFTNHYTRDIVGTLEKQIEIDFPMSTSTYSLINSLYFGPNIITPLFAGIAIKYFGQPSKFLCLVCVCAAIGHSIFYLGYNMKSIESVLIGRTIAGAMYEIIDTMPVIVLKPLFGSDGWSTAIGMINSFLRMGSVLCFVISPLLYTTSGVATALAFSAAVGWVGCLASVVGWATEGNSNGIVSALCSRLSSSEGKAIIVDYEEVAVDEDEDQAGDVDGLCEEENGRLQSSELDIASHGPIECSSDQSISDCDENEDIYDNDEREKNAIEMIDLTNPTKQNNKSLSPNSTTSCFSCLRQTFPLHELPLNYYLYCLSASFMYGAMVPFWFLGSKYLQNAHHLTVSKADSLMLVPEAFMVVFSPVLGIAMDRYPTSASTRLKFLSFSCALLAIAYLLLLLPIGFVISPVFCVLILGAGFTLSHGLIWFSITLLCPSSHFEFCSGFICSSINVLPTIVPPIVVWIYTATHKQEKGLLDTTTADGNHIRMEEYENGERVLVLWYLCGMALMASVCAMTASLTTRLIH